LNEVSTGGTLSSLFSILSLFTEDVKLSWSPDKTHGSPEQEVEEEEDLPTGRPEGKSRTNSDVSQLDEKIMGEDKNSPLETARPRSSSETSLGRRHRDSISSADDATIRDSKSDTEDEGDTTLNAVDFGQSPTPLRPSPARTSSIRPDPTRPVSDGPGPRRAKMGPTALNGTIARATVDTTLAVIPAEAFRKLTRKFPKASGTIVQVVLERFSRVTFMTGETRSSTQRRSRGRANDQHTNSLALLGRS
jgi:lysophospholipid hydrolase